MPHFKASIWCKFCGKMGHYQSQCWWDPNNKPGPKSKPSAQSSNIQGPPPSRAPAPDQPEARRVKRKWDEVKILQAVRQFLLLSFLQGREIPSILDTGATCSVLAKSMTVGCRIEKADTRPIKVGDGRVKWTEGSTVVDVQVGNLPPIQQQVQVLDTTAFQMVLGMDFLNHDRVHGLLTKPTARLIVDGVAIPVDTSG